MKKFDYQYDNIVDWLYLKPEDFLKELGFDPYSEILNKDREFEVWNEFKSIRVGYFDVVLKLKHNDEIVSLNFIVDVKMESATLLLRELKDLKRIHSANVKTHEGNPENERYIIVSRNEAYSRFFTDQGDLFYHFTYQIL